MLAYLTIFVFILVSLAVPGGMLLLSKLIRVAAPSNDVQAENYESAEEPIGREVGVMAEYFPYFSVFLFAEVFVAVSLAWAYAEEGVSSLANFFMLAFLAGVMLFSWILIWASRAGARR